MTFCSACGAALPHRPPVTCPSCGTQHWSNAKPCAGALIMRDGRLLLMRRRNEPWKGRWDIPGGFCDGAEHPADTARREAREEVGLDVELTGFLGIWMDRYPGASVPAPPPGGGPSGEEPEAATLNAYYHAVAPGTAPGRPDPDEATELGWFGPDDLPAEVAFPHHATAVLAAWREALRQGQTATPLPDVAGNGG